MVMGSRIILIVELIVILQVQNINIMKYSLYFTVTNVDGCL